ncbi:MAG: phosphatidylglycerophosphatase A [Magnetococcales bacterium]|nr:phosphatidylglycerophosphatase A [Magnetococcales bacterium]
MVDVSPIRAKNRWAMAIATLAGTGRSPIAPGSVGTLVTLPPGVGLALLGPWFLGAGFLIVTVVGFWAATVASREIGHKDPGEIVIDEAAGLLLTLLFAPTGWIGTVAAFLLFRLFDITKPWPVGWLDRNLGGGVGIMVDDLAAGLYAGGVLTLLSAASPAWGELLAG